MQLFVSYRSTDSKKVDSIVARLRARPLNYKVWQDKDSIPAGQDWWEAICQGIKTSDVFLFMLSRESVKSLACQAELSFAYQLNLPIIPFVLEDEWVYGENSGKYNIEFWHEVPAEITNHRAQLLFYKGASFVDELQAGINVLLAQTPPRFPATPPPDPRHATDASNNPTVIYDEACDYALRGELSTAETLFRKLIKDAIFKDISHQWVLLIRRYHEIRTMAERKHTRKIAEGHWLNYIRDFPQDLLDDIFDPHSLAQLFTTSADAQELSTPPPQQPPSAPASPTQQPPPPISQATPTLTLLSEYTKEKQHDIDRARSLLDEIAKKHDVPIFFDIKQEYKDLEIAFQQAKEAEEARQRLRQIDAQYQSLIHFVETSDLATAQKAIVRFITTYPDYPIPSNLRQKYTLTSAALMPQPFEWIKIPAGKGTLQADGVTLPIPDQDYWLAKYPTTNAQFAKFIETNGYENERWWTKEGWQYRQKEKWTLPRFWKDAKFNHPEQPVVGVSWYEATAFCLWLSELTGEKIMLPTEAQWQYAAQGTDGRVYPWGNDWDASRANSKESGIGKTSPVTQYEGKTKGDSPFGVVDMAGNVWEWCLTDYDNRTNDLNSHAGNRVLRGGSWNFRSAYLRVAVRHWLNPINGINNYGFRFARSL